jgi:hypothetical protein
MGPKTPMGISSYRVYNESLLDLSLARFGVENEDSKTYARAYLMQAVTASTARAMIRSANQDQKGKF